MAVKSEPDATPAKHIDTFAISTAKKKVIQCMPRIRPVSREICLKLNWMTFPRSQIPRIKAVRPVLHMTSE